ncbi:MAG: AmmeMemoRadiSam system protein A [Verrucomicrobia bacterium]|nr:AmmeMemoRadiSam system protein A [Verrucomicrobiota bacterium]
MLEQTSGSSLFSIARNAIFSFFTQSSPSIDLYPPWGNEIKACFITLEKNNTLRGCCGTVFPYRSLIEDLKNNAIQAAFQDPRFPPLQKEEFDEISIKISILSPIEPLYLDKEEDLFKLLRPNEDGLVLQWNTHRSTFLPSTWTLFPKVEDFVFNLREKAKLPKNFWVKDLHLFRYTVTTWSENL